MRKKIFLFLIIVLLIYFIGDYFYQIAINKQNKIKNSINFVISSGKSVSQISDNLFAKGLIKSKNLFKFYIWQQGLQTKLQAGKYKIRNNYSLKDLVDIFTNGKIINQEKIVKILEGWNIDNINSYLSADKIIANNNFAILAKTKIKDWPFSFKRPKFLDSVSPKLDLEGYLFPDTYRIFYNAKADDLIKKMLDNFSLKLTPQMRQDISARKLNMNKIITMASLIQKEVRKEKDMKIVSGIFWNRIKNYQALQSCATLAYILKKNKPQYSLLDTKINSPYNTYIHRGLPPGPICNPGLSAIKAAIYPEYTDYNYFLNSFDTGETIFSKTYAEHLRNKKKYLK